LLGFGSVASALGLALHKVFALTKPIDFMEDVGGEFLIMPREYGVAVT
jgi:hypothetical protein